MPLRERSGGRGAAWRPRSARGGARGVRRASRPPPWDLPAPEKTDASSFAALPRSPRPRRLPLHPPTPRPPAPPRPRRRRPRGRPRGLVRGGRPRRVPAPRGHVHGEATFLAPRGRLRRHVHGGAPRSPQELQRQAGSGTCGSSSSRSRSRRSSSSSSSSGAAATESRGDGRVFCDRQKPPQKRALPRRGSWSSSGRPPRPPGGAGAAAARRASSGQNIKIEGAHLDDVVAGARRRSGGERSDELAGKESRSKEGRMDGCWTAGGAVAPASA